LTDLRWLVAVAVLNLRRMGTSIKFYPLTLQITYANNVPANSGTAANLRKQNSANSTFRPPIECWRPALECELSCFVRYGKHLSCPSVEHERFRSLEVRHQCL